MSRHVPVLPLVASPAAAQVKLTPKATAGHRDPCVPIGRTADGKLVYSMKCENLPPPPQAELKKATPPALGARGATERHSRLVLRPQVIGCATCAKSDGMLFAWKFPVRLIASDPER